MRASLSLMPAPVEYQPTITSFGFTRKCSSSMVLWYSMSSATCGVGEYIFTHISGRAEKYGTTQTGRAQQCGHEKWRALAATVGERPL